MAKKRIIQSNPDIDALERAVHALLSVSSYTVALASADYIYDTFARHPRIVLSYFSNRQSAQQSVQRIGGTRRKNRHSSSYVGGKHANR